MHPRNLKHCIAVGVHDVDGTKIESVCLQRLAMSRGDLPGTWIEDVAFHNRAVRNVRLQASNKFDGQQVRPMRFAGVELDAHFASHSSIDFGVDFQQSAHADIPCKKYLRFRLCGCGVGDAAQVAYGNATRAIAPFFKKVRRNIWFSMPCLSPFNKGRLPKKYSSLSGRPTSQWPPDSARLPP